MGIDSLQNYSLDIGALQDPPLTVNDLALHKGISIQWNTNLIQSLWDPFVSNKILSLP